MQFDRTADNNIVLTYQVSSVQLVTNKYLEALKRCTDISSPDI